MPLQPVVLQDEERALSSLKIDELKCRVRKLVNTKRTSRAGTVRVVLTGFPSSDEESAKVPGCSVRTLDLCTSQAMNNKLHADIKFVVKFERLDAASGSSETRCLLDLGLEPQVVRQSVEQALLPANASSSDPCTLRRLAFIYSDDDESVVVRVWISDVDFLHRLRDNMLDASSDGFEERLAISVCAKEALAKLTAQHAPVVSRDLAEPSCEARLRVEVDRSHFAEMYEASILALDQLTPHQEKQLELCHGHADVHVRAPAGAGKTFIALHMMLEILLGAADSYVLFVAKTRALGLFIAKWLTNRLPQEQLAGEATGERLHLLERLHVVAPAAGGRLSRSDRPRGVRLSADQRRFEFREVAEKRSKYGGVFVDEAHHLYMDLEVASIVTDLLKMGTDKRMLLSDTSQSPGVAISYDTGLEANEIVLNEIVRSSQRIVVGANTFRFGGGGTEAAAPVCYHGSKGPPIKTFLFEMSGSTYLDQTLHAIRHLRYKYGKLNLHDRLAIVVPDEDFLRQLQPPLQAALDAEYNSFELVSAEQASAACPRRSWHPLGNGLSKQWLLLDTSAQFDGLERLIVIAVGLDAVIDDSTGTLETRSRLYRALTRAHMIALVVNRRVRGGWLEFLGHVKFDDQLEFQYDQEQGKLANEEQRMAALNAAIRQQIDVGARLLSIELSPKVKDALMQRIKGKQSATQEDVKEEVRLCKVHQAQVDTELQAATASWAPARRLAMEAMKEAVTLDVLRGTPIEEAVASAIQLDDYPTEKRRISAAEATMWAQQQPMELRANESQEAAPVTTPAAEASASVNMANEPFLSAPEAVTSVFDNSEDNVASTSAEYWNPFCESDARVGVEAKPSVPISITPAVEVLRFADGVKHDLTAGHILSEFIDNSLTALMRKYENESWPKVPPTIRLHMLVSEDGNHFAVCIEDEGCGMTDKDLSQSLKVGKVSLPTRHSET